MARQSLYGIVATDTHPSTAEVVRHAQHALEDVVLPAVAGAGCQLSLTVTRVGEDLSREKPLRGVVWDRVPLDEPLEGFTVAGTRPARPVADQLLRVNVDFSRPIGPPGGVIGESDTTVSFSVALSSLPAEQVSGDLQKHAVAWMKQTFTALAGTAGYLTVDYVMAGPGAMSPYERAVMRPPAFRDFRREVWGYFWGMPLPAWHVAALGGEEALAAAPVARVEPLPDGAWWLQLSDDINDIERDALARLRAFLTPLLPEGTQPLETFDGNPPYRV